MTDNLYVGEDARARLVAGIRKCKDAVGVTMGASGSNAVIEAIENPGHLTTNDGETILKSIHLADPMEEMGRKILLEAVARANKQSGDGSSTTTVLTAAIIEEGMKHLKEHSPMEIKRSLDACIPLIAKALKKQKRDVGVGRIGKVAAVSAEDPEIGALIQEIYKQIGKEGIIHWDISKTPEDSYTIGQGITVEGAGFVSPYMCDADDSGHSTNQIRLKNVNVLVTKQKIASAGDFNNIGAALDNKGVKELVVFCDEVDPLVMPDLIKTRMVRGFRFILVKMPVLWKDEWYEDLFLATGATIVEPGSGLTLKDVKVDNLGIVGNILITKDASYLDGIDDLTNHIRTLTEMVEDGATARAARLNTKTARLYVGAYSDSALAYKRLKVEDAISAAWQALHGGVVLGGGFALYDASSSVPKDTIGGQILFEALCAPIRQIERNMGHQLNRAKLTRDSIRDPLPVVLNAAKNAISVAAAILTANTVVTLPRQEMPQMQFPVQV